MYPEITHCTYLSLAFSLNIKFLSSIPDDLYRSRALSFIALSKAPSLLAKEVPLFTKYIGAAQPLLTLSPLINAIYSPSLKSGGYFGKFVEGQIYSKVQI